MDQSTTRRRRHAGSAESVSVADLLARSTPAERASVSAIKARSAAEANARAAEEAMARSPIPSVGMPPGAEPAGAEAPRVSNRLSRTIIVATIAMLVCGLATATEVLTAERPNRPSPAVPSVGPVEITGATVVRPDLLNEMLASGLPVATSTATNNAPAVTLPDDPDATGTVVLPAPPTDLTEPVTTTEQVRRLILAFYDAAERSPGVAYHMLGPQMRGDGLTSFVQGWGEQINNVEVQDLVVGPGGVARAVVVVAWRDATVLRTEQILLVSDGPNPKIVRARLLSAHRG